MPKSPHGYDTKSWSPVTGCSKVSAGCKNCWAEEYSRRMGWPWKVTLHPERLDEPLKWRKPQVVACCYVGDLFHEDVDDQFTSLVFAVMSMAPQHIFLVLTKRPNRMSEYLAEMSADPDAYVFEWAREANNVFLDGAIGPPPVEKWPLPNVYLGVSIEDQATADERIPLLVRMKAEGAAAHIWVSFEPLLENLSINHQLVRQLDWAVIGGESGPKARRMRASWLAQLASQCATLRVPCYVKQASHRYPGRQGDIPDALWARKAVPW